MILEDLQKAIKLMGNNWQKQNNLLDRKTKFIYYVETNEKIQKAYKQQTKNATI